MKNLKRNLCISIAALLATSTVVKAATPGTWEVKVRAAHLSPADKSDEFSALGMDFGANAITVSDKWIPEFDIAYAFTENWLVELVLTIPQIHDVHLAGVGRIGTIKHLPPTLSAVYEFSTNSPFRPYLSAGLNMTWIMDDDLEVGETRLDLDGTSIGLALGAGARYAFDSRWGADVSVKWITLNTDVSVAGQKLTSASLNPWLISLGVVYKF